MIFCLFPLLLAMSLSSSAFAADSTDSQDLLAIKKLEIYLEQVEDNARRSREWGGGILIGIGTASAIGGIATAVTGSSVEIPISLGVTGLVLGGIGALIRVSPMDQETLPPQFLGMPEITPENRAEKRLLGESYLSIFGHQAKRNRLMGSTLNIVLGTVLIGWYASENQGSYRTVNSFLLLEGAVLGAIGVAGLFVETDVEAALKDYNTFKSGPTGILKTARFGVSPFPSGGVASLSFSF